MRSNTIVEIWLLSLPHLLLSELLRDDVVRPLVYQILQFCLQLNPENKQTNKMSKHHDIFQVPADKQFFSNFFQNDQFNT